MNIESRRGTVTGITKTGKGGRVECLLGEEKASLHSDLTRLVKEGDDLLVAGELRDGVLHALALKNMTQDKNTQIDGSNYILLMGFGLFFWLLGFIFYMQTLPLGETMIITLNGLLSIAGFVVGIWAIIQVLRIKRAGQRVTYGAETL